MRDQNTAVVENIRILSQVVLEICLKDNLQKSTDLNLSHNQFYLLKILSNRDKLGISEIAHVLGISNAAASKNIENMQKDGLVTRAVGEKDRRQQFVSIAEEGQNIITKFNTISSKKQNAVLSKFSDNEKDQFLDYLGKFIQGLLSDHQKTDLICMQCDGNCGDDCVISACSGTCSFHPREGI
ncbi:winged helix-turn-helix transcriptional regulator [bacterium]|nr:winged helix-turn-helix transcriptional regulator [bacterium]MBT4291755.1 winged helix-turn-helix transcriptional regulator [bacterium]MBT7310848.1 winged helix-turn-helix transcriptional regulator [bacterium]